MLHPERRLVLATQNAGKLKELRKVLAGWNGNPIVSLADFSPITEPEETGDTFAENAQQKALYYARSIHETTGELVYCLADDSGLVVDALEGQPGVHSARYASDEAPADAPRDVLDQANNDKLLRELANTPPALRTARFVCHLTCADHERVLLESAGTLEGQIGYSPAGDNGFGYDPLFFIPAMGRTTAQLDPLDKNAISHRGQALRQFVDALRAQ
jgi:XTP/dITP diphosphohydrolase